MSGNAPATPFAGLLAGAALLAAAACTQAPSGTGAGAEVEAAETAAAASPPVAAVPVAVPVQALEPALEPALQPPPAAAAAAGPPPPLPRDKPERRLRVVAGDTVIGIARRHGVSAHAIIALNALTHPYWLRTGQRIRLPEEAYRSARRDEVPEDLSQDAPPAGDDVRARASGDRMERAPASTPKFAAPSPPTPPSPPATRVARAVTDSSARVSSAPAAPVSAVYRPAANAVPLPPSRNTFLWPIEGRVISGFGSKPGGTHNDGINIAAPLGSDIRASKNGVVAYAGNELRGYGNLVLIRHEHGWMTAYAHNDTLLVGRGDTVRRGQVISRSGKSGRVSRPQAHFEIRRNGEPQDPLRLLRAPQIGPQAVGPPPGASPTPSRPARSWTNCQATRPERAPRVMLHSIASACSASRSMARSK